MIARHAVIKTFLDYEREELTTLMAEVNRTRDGTTLVFVSAWMEGGTVWVFEYENGMFHQISFPVADVSYGSSEDGRSPPLSTVEIVGIGVSNELNSASFNPENGTLKTHKITHTCEPHCGEPVHTYNWTGRAFVLKRIQFSWDHAIQGTLFEADKQLPQ